MMDCYCSSFLTKDFLMPDCYAIEPRKTLELYCLLIGIPSRQHAGHQRGLRFGRWNRRLGIIKKKKKSSGRAVLETLCVTLSKSCSIPILWVSFIRCGCSVCKEVLGEITNMSMKQCKGDASQGERCYVRAK